ncbi:MAG: hypothetical protein ACOYMN_01350 [Roseimicrobium sp.]
MGSGKHFWNGLRDFIVLGVILAGVNFLIDRADPGWLRMNPTPWLLPAALIGARYGFSGGLFSGLVVAASVALARSYLGNQGLDEVVHATPYFFLAVVVIGAAAGELGRLLRQRSAAVLREGQRLEEENARLRSQLQLVDETRHQLQQQLALFNAPMCVLDEELSSLFSYPTEEFGKQLLRTLHRLTGLTSAGIYVVKHGQLTQTAVLHPTPPLAETLSLEATPLAQQAVSTDALASVPDATQLSTLQPFLAAFPWLDHMGRTSVLLIQDMPLEAYTLQNLARLELILSWASAIAVLRRTFTDVTAAKPTISNEDFHVLLAEALEADRLHSLPSALLRLDLAGGAEVRQALGLLPNTALISQLPGGGSLAVLLPFSGEREALDATRQITAHLPQTRCQRYLITGNVTAQDLWAALQQ